MKNRRDLNEFKKTASVLSKILKVIYVISMIGLVMGLIGLVAVNVIPKSVIENILSSGNVTNTITLAGLSFVIENTTLAAAEYVKMFSILLVCIVIMIGFVMLCMKKLLKIMDIVKKGTPFTEECVSAIRGLGILVIVSGVIIPMISSAVEYFVVNIFKIQELLLANPGISNVSYKLEMVNATSILLGVIIIILSGIFQYGCYLQDEYDSTL